MNNAANLPPQSIEIEQSVLAAALYSFNAAREISDSLTESDFYRAAHQKIFRVIAGETSKNDHADSTMLYELLKSSGQLDSIGGGTYIYKLLDSPVPPNIENYCAKIKEKAALRDLMFRCMEIAQGCQDCQNDVGGFIDSAQRKILKVDVGSKATAVHIADMADARLDTYELRRTQKGKITGVPSGYPALDYMTSGFQKSDLIYIGARPSMGKTALAVNFARKQAVKMKIPVLVYSLEMSKEQLFDRTLAIDGRVNSEKFRNGRFADEDWRKITETCGKLINTPLFIDDSAEPSISAIRNKARKMIKYHGIKIIYIDYIQLMDGPGNGRYEKLTSISKGLKLMAKELDVPVVVVSQLSRKLEDRDNKRPKLSDLRESGSLEQDADLILFLYRDEVYDKDENNPNKGIAELELAKQRNGPIGTVHLTWNAGYTRFDSLAYEQYNERGEQ